MGGAGNYLPCFWAPALQCVCAVEQKNSAMASEQLQQAVTLLQVEDVYEIATRVSEEFQELASQFGGSRLATIIPIVLDALEQLERAVTANQQLEIKVRRLILSNDALKREKEGTDNELKVLTLVAS